MPVPEIDNATPYAFEPMALLDEEARAVLTGVAKATFSLRPDRRELELAEQQQPIYVGGEHWGDPESSSLRYEPDTAFTKLATDVVLLGFAYPARPRDRQVDVRLQVGSLHKTVRVFGDRVWNRSGLAAKATGPIGFDRIPLVYERAFGGWDRRDPDVTKHTFEPRNPVGTGFCGKGGPVADGVRLPNLEDPTQPIKKYGDKPNPAGFGFVSPHWVPRAAAGGTYDDDWRQQRCPLLPQDFDRRYFNAASAGLVADGYLRGDEWVQIENAHPGEPLRFRLPGVANPRLEIKHRDGKLEQLHTALDTVVLEPQEQRVTLCWRAHTPLADSLHHVAKITLEESRQ